VDSFEKGKVSKQKEIQATSQVRWAFQSVGKDPYKIELSGEYGVSATSNVADLSPYLDVEETLPSLRTNSSQVGEDDGDQSQDVSITKVAYGPSREIAFLMAVYETSQLASSRNWPVFVTLVS